MTTNTNLTKRKTIVAADMWCGGGGTSTGLVRAVADIGCNLELTALNHWDIAVKTHSTNHPKVRHFCKSVDGINPLEIYKDQRLQLLVASPECVHHSRARGGKPRSEQKRADAWDLQRWIEKLYIENLLIENVREFVDWGPLKSDGSPDKRHKGKYFNQFIDFLRILYNVEWRVLNCADYGDATTRERFFLIARRPKSKKIFFPEPSHASRKVIEKAKMQPVMFGESKADLKPWVSAREIIDWELPGKSIFGRKKPLSENTMKRIFAGLFKYSLKPFLMGTGGPTGQQQPRSVDDPVRTILTDHRQNLFEPYLVNLKATTRRMREIDEPIFTQCAANHQMLVEPFMVNLSHTKNNDAAMCKSLNEPLNTICGKAMLGLLEPFLVQYFGGATAKSVDDPVPTICANYEHYGLAEPFIIPCANGAKNGKTDERCHSIDAPLGTVTGVNNWALLEPFLVRFNNYQGAESVDEPLKTLTTKDRYGLCIPQIGAILDIRFRLLQPHELAAAMGFPKNYFFAGTRTQQVKQIGNAVPVETAKALCKVILEK